LDRAAEAILARGARPGIAVVFSDLLDAGAGLVAAHRLAVARYETTVVHVLADEELCPGVAGEATLVDSETGEVLDLVVDAAAQARYAARVAQWVADTGAAARQRGVRYVRA